MLVCREVVQYICIPQDLHGIDLKWSIKVILHAIVFDLRPMIPRNLSCTTREKIRHTILACHFYRRSSFVSKEGKDEAWRYFVSFSLRISTQQKLFYNAPAARYKILFFEAEKFFSSKRKNLS